MPDKIRINPRHISEFPNGITINGSRVAKSATFIVAASDSLHPDQADYVCDGVDDQVQIQAAIDALPDTGGKIATIGHFHTSDTIHMYRDVSTWFNLFLQGEGLKATTIELDAGSDCDMIDVEVLDYNSGWKGVADMMLDGNESDQAAGNGIHCFKTGSGNMYDMRFHNVFAYDMKQRGFKIISGWGVYLTNCLAEYCGGDGIYLDGNECYIYGFHSSVNAAAGMSLKGSQLHISDCRIDAVDVGIMGTAISECTISNNNIRNFGISGGSRMGIYIYGDSHQNNIHDNTIKGNGAHSTTGITYEATGDIPNNIHDNLVDGCTGYSLTIGTSSAKNLHFHHNIITNPTAKVAFWASVIAGHIVKDNTGLNPLGITASPFDNTNFKIAPFKSGLASAPNTASQDYECVITPCRILSSGGTGVAITIKDAAGGTIKSCGATCDEELEVGWLVNFGGFSAAPTVVVVFK